MAAISDPGFKDVKGSLPGVPHIEVEAGGRLTVTKRSGTGRAMTEQTAKVHLIYEVHDSAAYLTPDVVADLSEATVSEVGPDRVEIRGIRGRPALQLLKTTVCCKGGWQCEAEICYAGPNALAQARLAGQVLSERLTFRAPELLRKRLGIIGHSSVFDDDAGPMQNVSTIANGDGDYRLRLR